MKVDEPQEIHNKVGVTFQRIPFETEIDIFPKMNPLVTSKGDRCGDTGDMTPLTSVQTEERIKETVQHRAREGDDEWLPVPLKRINSGPNIQEPGSATASNVQPTENNNVTHCELLDEIDHSSGPKKEAKGKTGKKDSTLTRMFKGFKVEKNNQEESEDKLGPQVSISKIFHRINPVGKLSRENFSKVFHRIGDAIQKKSEDEGSVTKSRTPDNRSLNSQPESTKFGHGEQKKIGEKMFRCRPSNTDARKTTG